VAVRRRARRVLATAAIALVGLAALLVHSFGGAADPPSPPAPSDSPAGSSPTARGTSSTQPGTPGGALRVSTTAIDLGRVDSQGSFQVVSAGQDSVLYTASSRQRWLAVQPIGGQLSSGQEATVVVSADRDALREGVSRARVLLTWDGGTAEVTVTLDEERAPTVTPPTARTTTSCRLEVRADVADDSRLTSVVLRVTGPERSRSVRMSPVTKGTWSAQLGARTGGSLTLYVVATDGRGNVTDGPPTTVQVRPCAG